jgi:hypothetical protein
MAALQEKVDLLMAQAAQNTGSSTESKGNGFSIPTESVATFEESHDRAFAAMSQSPSEFQQKPSPRDADTEGNTKFAIILGIALLAASKFCRDHYHVIIIIIAVFLAICLSGVAGATARRDTTGTQGIDLNAFGLDPYDIHHVRRQTRGAFTSAGQCVGIISVNWRATMTWG